MAGATPVVKLQRPQKTLRKIEIQARLIINGPVRGPFVQHMGMIVPKPAAGVIECWVGAGVLGGPLSFTTAKCQIEPLWETYTPAPRLNGMP